MNGGRESLLAYLATLAAIVVMTIAAAIIVVATDFTDETALAQTVAALAFIGAAVTGLIGVIGTFRPKGPPVAATETGDVHLGEGETT